MAHPFLHAAAAAASISLAACGGGGDPDPTYYAVQGTRSVTGLPGTVCIGNMAYVDPSSPHGAEITHNLAAYYGLTGGLRSYAGTGRSCTDQFPVLDARITVADYNDVVLPAVLAMGGSGGSPALPPPIACASGSGAGLNGITLSGSSRFGALTTAASTDTTVTVDPGAIAYRDASLTSNAITGTLRAQLWAVPQSYGGGRISGYVVATYDIRFTDGSNQLGNGQSSDLLEHTLSARTPPKGAYCMVLTLEEYDSRQCTDADHFCVVDWTQFGSSSSFR